MSDSSHVRHRQQHPEMSSSEVSSLSNEMNDEAHHHQSYDAVVTQENDHSSLHDGRDGLMKLDVDKNDDDNKHDDYAAAAAYAAVGVGAAAAAAAAHNSSDFWLTLAGVAGNVLEWYDFAVFGYFSDILGEVFFPPNQGGNSSTSETFLVFGGAFLMRPIGGALMGYIGDMYGRKKALVISIFLMAVPTFAMGCLPGYAQVGVWAIFLLVVVRLIQGLSVGGQLMSSLVFTLENHDPAKWGLYGSFVMTAANFGSLLGGITSFVLRASLTHQQLVAWGWRIPFLSGILVSFCGFYLKAHGGDHDGFHYHKPVGRNGGDEEENCNTGSVGNSNGVCNETSDETEEITASPTNPFVKAFSRESFRALLAASMVPMLWSAGLYLSFVWMPVFMVKLIDEPVPGAFALNSVALFFSVCLIFPLAGILSDRFGRVRIMTIGGMGMGILSPILVSLISRGNPALALFSQSVMGISLSLFGAPMCAWLVEAFEPGSRLTSVAIGYNIAQMISGGITPFLATLMVDKNIGEGSPGWILTIFAVIALTGLRCVAPPPPAESHPTRKPKKFMAVPTNSTVSSSLGGSECEMIGAGHDALDDDDALNDDDNELL